MIRPADDARRWQRRLFAGTAVAALVYLYLAFFKPLTLSYDPFAIQDDARQFLLWMPRLTDPELLRGDYMAAYWQSVSPLLYRVPFALAADLGGPPPVFGRLLAVPLLFLAAWAAWRLSMELTRQRPRAAFVAAAFLMGFVIHEDSIFTASPRAFSHPLLLVFFYGLLADRALPILAGLILLGALYPAPAIVGVTMLGLSRIRSLRPLRIDLSRRSLLLVIGGGLLTAAAMLPFVLQTDPWGPTLTLAQARAMPSMMDPSGRSTIVDSTGAIGWLCSWRMGYIPAIVPCGGAVPGARLWNLLLVLPLFALAARHLTGRRPADPGRLYVLALAATALWYVIAIAVAFRLHLPSRYSQRVLELLEWLAIGQMLGVWLDARLSLERHRKWIDTAAATTGVFILLSFLSPLPGMQRPADEALIAHVARLPKGARIGGVSEELNFIPALTGRAVLATPEHAIPYQLGYYRRVRAALQASLLMISTPDRQVFGRLLAAYPVDYLLIERHTLTTGQMAGRYPDILPVESAAATRRLLSARPIVASAPSVCLNYRSAEFLLIEAACVMNTAPHSPPPGFPSLASDGADLPGHRAAIPD